MESKVVKGKSTQAEVAAWVKSNGEQEVAWHLVWYGIWRTHTFGLRTLLQHVSMSRGDKHFSHIFLTSQRCWKRKGWRRWWCLPKTCLSPGPTGTQEVGFVSSENELLNYERNFPNCPDFPYDLGLSKYLGKVLLDLQEILQCEMLKLMEGNVKAVIKPDRLTTD